MMKQLCVYEVEAEAADNMLMSRPAVMRTLEYEIRAVREDLQQKHEVEFAGAKEQVAYLREQLLQQRVAIAEAQHEGEGQRRLQRRLEVLEAELRQTRQAEAEEALCASRHAGANTWQREEEVRVRSELEELRYIEAEGFEHQESLHKSQEEIRKLKEEVQSHVSDNMRQGRVSKQALAAARDESIVLRSLLAAKESEELLEAGACQAVRTELVAKQCLAKHEASQQRSEVAECRQLLERLHLAQHGEFEALQHAEAAVREASQRAVHAVEERAAADRRAAIAPVLEVLQAELLDRSSALAAAEGAAAAAVGKAAILAGCAAAAEGRARAASEEAAARASEFNKLEANHDAMFMTFKAESRHLHGELDQQRAAAAAALAEVVLLQSSLKDEVDEHHAHMSACSSLATKARQAEHHAMTLAAAVESLRSQLHDSESYTEREAELGASWAVEAATLAGASERRAQEEAHQLHDAHLARSDAEAAARRAEQRADGLAATARSLRDRLSDCEALAEAEAEEKARATQALLLGSSQALQHSTAWAEEQQVLSALQASCRSQRDELQALRSQVEGALAKRKQLENALGEEKLLVRASMEELETSRQAVSQGARLRGELQAKVAELQAVDGSLRREVAALRQRSHEEAQMAELNAEEAQAQAVLMSVIGDEIARVQALAAENARAYEEDAASKWNTVEELELKVDASQKVESRLVAEVNEVQVALQDHVDEARAQELRLLTVHKALVDCRGELQQAQQAVSDRDGMHEEALPEAEAVLVQRCESEALEMRKAAQDLESCLTREMRAEKEVFEEEVENLKEEAFQEATAGRRAVASMRASVTELVDESIQKALALSASAKHHEERADLSEAKLVALEMQERAEQAEKASELAWLRAEHEQLAARLAKYVREAAQDRAAEVRELEACLANLTLDLQSREGQEKAALAASAATLTRMEAQLQLEDATARGVEDELARTRDELHSVRASMTTSTVRSQVDLSEYKAEVSQLKWELQLKEDAIRQARSDGDFADEQLENLGLQVDEYRARHLQAMQRIHEVVAAGRSAQNEVVALRDALHSASGRAEEEARQQTAAVQRLQHTIAELEAQATEQRTDANLHGRDAFAVAAKELAELKLHCQQEEVRFEATLRLSSQEAAASAAEVRAEAERRHRLQESHNERLQRLERVWYGAEEEACEKAALAQRWSSECSAKIADVRQLKEELQHSEGQTKRTAAEVRTCEASLREWRRRAEHWEQGWQVLEGGAEEAQVDRERGLQWHTFAEELVARHRRGEDELQISAQRISELQRTHDAQLTVAEHQEMRVASLASECRARGEAHALGTSEREALRKEPATLKQQMQGLETNFGQTVGRNRAEAEVRIAELQAEFNRARTESLMAATTSRSELSHAQRALSEAEVGVARLRSELQQVRTERTVGALVSQREVSEMQRGLSEAKADLQQVHSEQSVAALASQGQVSEARRELSEAKVRVVHLQTELGLALAEGRAASSAVQGKLSEVRRELSEKEVYLAELQRDVGLVRNEVALEVSAANVARSEARRELVEAQAEMDASQRAVLRQGQRIGAIEDQAAQAELSQELRSAEAQLRAQHSARARQEQWLAAELVQSRASKVQATLSKMSLLHEDVEEMRGELFKEEYCLLMDELEHRRRQDDQTVVVLLKLRDCLLKERGSPQKENGGIEAELAALLTSLAPTPQGRGTVAPPSSAAAARLLGPTPSRSPRLSAQSTGAGSSSALLDQSGLTAGATPTTPTTPPPSRLPGRSPRLSAWSQTQDQTPRAATRPCMTLVLDGEVPLRPTNASPPRPVTSRSPRLSVQSAGRPSPGSAASIEPSAIFGYEVPGSPTSSPPSRLPRPSSRSSRVSTASAGGVSPAPSCTLQHTPGAVSSVVVPRSPGTDSLASATLAGSYLAGSSRLVLGAQGLTPPSTVGTPRRAEPRQREGIEHVPPLCLADAARLLASPLETAQPRLIAVASAQSAAAFGEVVEGRWVRRRNSRTSAGSGSDTSDSHFAGLSAGVH